MDMENPGKMNTPICDFVRDYNVPGKIRMHMPGHKGRGTGQLSEALDITEIQGADALYEASGIIRESEENAAALFGTGATLYSTEGSSQVIRAMLYLAGLYAKRKGERVLILAARNVHKAFIYAAALLDYDVEWLYGDGSSLISCEVTERELENTLKKALKTRGRLPDAVFITSPDYLGKTADIRALAGLCHAYGLPLLVDNAHGAYLHFLPEEAHPLDLGADLCCDSAHKTLPVLTGGAYLQVAKGTEESGLKRQEMLRFFRENARGALALFGSTSPSYLILQSLDACNAYLADGYREKLERFVGKLDALKKELLEAGIPVMKTDPLKLSLAAGKARDGRKIAEALRMYGIECEFADEDALVLMLTPENTEEELRILSEALTEIYGSAPGEEEKPREKARTLKMNRPERVLSIREAVLSPHEVIPVEDAAGRIAGAPTVSCPPAVPIVVSGERITEDALEWFRRYGIREVEVVLHSSTL